MSDIVNSLKEPGSKKWVVVGGGAVAAYLAYKYYKNKSAAATSTAGTPATGVTADTASEAALIDPNTGIPYSEEEDYGAIPSGLTFNAQTGQFQPAASTIVGGATPYSTNTGQSASGDPNSLLSTYLPGSFYIDYTTGNKTGGIYGVDSLGNTIPITSAEWKALASQGALTTKTYGTPPVPTSTPAVPVAK